MSLFLTIARVALALALALATPSLASADADAKRVGKLAHTLTTSSSAKARLSAAVALGELRDARSLRPLIRALGDKNKTVRAVAAKALGFLGDSKALPALKRATRDRDKSVRRASLEAITLIRRGPQVASKKTSKRRRSRSSRARRLASYRLAAREAPRLKARAPAVYVVLKSTSDESRGKTRKKARKRRVRRMKSVMASTLRGAPGVTTNAAVAEKHRLKPFYIDLTIQNFKRRVSGPYVEIECQLRVAVSNQRGKMLSVMTGGAKVQVPKHTFRRRYEAALRLEALESAVQGIHGDVITYLQQNPS
ncbi:MAG: HEAT repeat domain-containing protein [Deltaproteobacteria bacterium]|nr:HEAT repeat domain-containing protein [Deltaproteobacteria bacterium]